MRCIIGYQGIDDLLTPLISIQSPVLRFHTSQQKYNCQIQAVAIPGKRASVTVIQAYHHGLLSGILSSYVDS